MNASADLLKSPINDKTIDKGKYLDLFISSFKIDFKKLEDAVKKKDEVEIRYNNEKLKYEKPEVLQAPYFRDVDEQKKNPKNG